MQPEAMERAGYWWRDVSVAAPPPTAGLEEPPPPDPDVEAERYAVIYPNRAVGIRAADGLPKNLDFGPPDADIVAALLCQHPAVSQAA